MQSKSPGQQTISTYLAKYLSKSFHLRSLYQQHGLTEKRQAYRFFRHLYEYEELPVLLAGKSKLDQRSGQLLNGRQKVFRRYHYSSGQTSYFYRTSEKLVGYCLKPVLIKKNYRLGTRSLQPLNLLKLVQKQSHQAKLEWKKPKATHSTDFQEHLLTQLLFFCETAQFIQLPLEQEKVPKEISTCNQNIHSHFKSKPLLHFTFSPQTVPLVLKFLDQLDNLAQQFEVESSQDFYFWPNKRHDFQHETLRNSGSPCGCETQARNTYLNYWTHLASDYSSAQPP
ncbi:MAG: hypothetical protein I3274_02605 [Candidatus Moeniiplasma glomeromycotorum]|nr:hypothetical protein [Candidatus Moeniiplasma glomeromycotorum]MCE8167495.1 hypothetical protein [Candidatus Moeniiplasma glomeromycotorum]